MTREMRVTNSSASRIAQPSSPGCAKSKKFVQNKLQPTAASAKKVANDTSAMKASNLQKPLANSKLTNSKLVSPSSGLQLKTSPDAKPISKIKAPEQRSRNPEFQTQTPKPAAVNIISKLNYRSSLPRLSQRNSDASSSESSTESTSSRNTPISGIASSPSSNASPSLSKIRTSPQQPDKKTSNIAPQTKFAMHGRAASALELKRSANFNRENATEYSSQRKVSSSGIPALRSSKKSLDSPSLTRENTLDTIDTQKISKITPAAKQRCVSTESLKIRYQSSAVDSARSKTFCSSIPHRSSQTNLSTSSENNKSKLSLPSPKISKKIIPKVSETGPIEVQIDKKLIDNFQKVTVNADNEKVAMKNNLIQRSPHTAKRSLQRSALPRRGSENILDAKTKATKKNTEDVLKIKDDSAASKLNSANNESDNHSISYPIVGKIPDALNTSSRILKLGSPPKRLNEATLNEMEPERNLKLLSSFHSNVKVIENDLSSLSFENIDNSTPILTKDKESDSSCIYKLDIPDEDGKYNDSVSYDYTKCSKVVTTKIAVSSASETTENTFKSSLTVSRSPRVDPFNGICLDTCCKEDISNKGTCDQFDRKKLSNIKTIEPPRATPSPFRRINPKVAIPPPQINSISNTGEFLIANEYARTPSTDGEELYLSNYYSESSELKRKAREKALKTWQKGSSDEVFDKVKEDQMENELDFDDDSMGSEEKINATCQQTSNHFDDQEAMARQRHLSDGSINATNDINMYNIVGTMTLGRDKKKKSKLKKFFKKLSTKKDGSNTKIEIDGTSDYFSSNDGLSRTSTSSSNNSTSNTKSRRRSDGTLSSHSINDFNVILNNNNNNTLNSRRRTFLNLSFIKKATTRKRSHTYTTDYKRQPDIYTSQTVKALCSPHLPRKRLNDFSVLRRGSDPSLYVIEYPVAYSKRGCDRRNDVITYSRLVRTNTQRSSDRRSSHKSSVSSNENDNADYANYPFSKVNVKAPKKPERNHRNGSCSDPFQNTNNDSFGSEKGKNDWNTNNGGNMKFLAGDYRNSTTSSDASSVSDFYSSSRKSDISTENAPIRSSSSLRRTPLRRSIDSFNNLLEVHKQTIDKIAYEISMLHCSCANVQSLDWTDFDRHDELIPLGLSQYMISPVRSHKDKRCYTAWLRIKNQRVSNPKTQGIDYTKSTLHRNCLHVCHLIEQKYQSPNQTGIPTSLQVDHVYISPQVPKMTLAKYTSVTVEKHTKYPEIYEREAAIVLLQIIKALEHYYRHDVIVTTVNTENIVILKTSDSPITLSPRHEPNKCPMIALAALPGFENAHGDSDEDEPIANVCFQLAFVLLELLHSPYHEEVGDAADIAMLLSVLPDLTIKSTYSRHLQYVINFLLTSSSDRFKTFEEMKLILGVILFGPTEISDHDEEEAIVLINKWHNRRCVDMVTHILKEAPLIMLYASGSSTHDIENLKSIDQEIILECEFLSEVLPNNIYRISKKLNR